MSIKDKIIIKDTLLALIKKHQKIKPLDELLRVNEVLYTYIPTENIELIENLKLASEIVNELRKKIKYSSTHPDYNYYNKKVRVAVSNRMKKIRSLQSDNTCSSLMELSYLTQHLKSANCSEMSDGAILLLHAKATREYKAFKLSIENGDHNFIIFSNVVEDEIVYNNIVFCDPWSGNVGKFTAENIKKYFGDFQRTYINKNTPVNFITSYNPEYHRLKIRHTYKILPDKIENVEKI
ncbi:MAG: hypothetical protein H0U57_13320 [Tatlockia sp.]|nr:hypothetical protein [Tatlockia sp.]